LANLRQDEFFALRFYACVKVISGANLAPGFCAANMVFLPVKSMLTGAAKSLLPGPEEGFA
jgi:hypothetical protein